MKLLSPIALGLSYFYMIWIFTGNMLYWFVDNTGSFFEVVSLTLLFIPIFKNLINILWSKTDVGKELGLKLSFISMILLGLGCVINYRMFYWIKEIPVLNFYSALLLVSIVIVLVKEKNRIESYWLLKKS